MKNYCAFSIEPRLLEKVYVGSSAGIDARYLLRAVRIVNLVLRFGLSFLFFTLWISGVQATPTEVTNVRIGVHGEKTRIVLDTNEKFSYRVFLLSNPYRVVIDLPKISWRAPFQRLKKPRGAIANYRFGLFRPGNSRVVVDVTGPVKVVRHAFLAGRGKNPSRFFLDLKPVDAETFEQFKNDVIAQNWTKGKTPNSIPRVVSKATDRKNDRKIIMIDPGHGGVDPGAIGPRGTFEKRVTLKVAKSVKYALEASGRYIVRLTRDRDIYLPLRDRFRKAESVGAELFISLHADTIKNRRIRGASVYTLSEKASDSEAEALALKENRSDVIAGVDLTKQSDPVVASVLIDLRQRHTLDQSAHFARFMVDNLAKDIRLLRNTHRFAGFAVLKSLEVPSVLVELGYLSNREDEKMLRTKAFRKRVSKAILRAVDKFFARLNRISKP